MSKFNGVEDVDRDLLKKIFDKIYDIAFCGEIQDEYDIPYEFEAGGEIEAIIHKIYDTERKIVFDVIGEDFDIDDYSALRDLDNLYDRLAKTTNYKMFLYGVFLNLHTTEESENLFIDKNSESIYRKMELISDFVKREKERVKREKIIDALCEYSYKQEQEKLKREKLEQESQEYKVPEKQYGMLLNAEKSIHSKDNIYLKIKAAIKNLFSK